MKTIKTSMLIRQQKIAFSITVSPLLNPAGRVEYYELLYSLRNRKKKVVFVEKIIEDVNIPDVSNSSVKHLGYNIYKYYESEGFYINYYKAS